ncbi:hypothetical protein DWB77_00077 [Streptomyces hundungensis]|uniref:Uncharacterized protein n=1 Tax=Streptomyces hundungensis TaxID=1077946 RepID=A0A387HAJ7_9ACTN|nr:hypothetical protein [Streptomyces hundungensis]AYG77970.1 hypothetical protein DWB77_00077 [Streptomyces hundungensis]
MTSSDWDRSRRRAQTIGTLAVLAVLTAVITLGATVGVPEAWWPQIGSAFAAGPKPTPPAASAGPCALITGPAKDSCTATPASSGAQPDGAGAADAWRLAVPAAGLILVHTVRSSGRRRR